MKTIDKILSGLRLYGSYGIPGLTQEMVEDGDVDPVLDYVLDLLKKDVRSFAQRQKLEKQLKEEEEANVVDSFEEQEREISDLQQLIAELPDILEYHDIVDTKLQNFSENNPYGLKIIAHKSGSTESLYIDIYDSEGDSLYDNFRISAHSRPGYEKNAVTKVGPDPYIMRNLPPGPENPERLEDGYGLTIPNEANPEAETDRHPEFHNKTDLVRDPDYGQGVTMDVGINL